MQESTKRSVSNILFSIGIITMFFATLATFFMVGYMLSLQKPVQPPTVIERVKEIVVTPSPTVQASESATPSPTLKNSRVKVTPTSTEKPTPTPSD